MVGQPRTNNEDTINKRRHGIVFLAIVIFLLAGCSPTHPEGTVSGNAPQFIAGGSAAQNEFFFRESLKKLGVGNRFVSTNEVVRMLVTAGFSESKISHTKNTTKTGLVAEDVSLSIRIGNECLLAQYSKNSLTTGVGPTFPNGNCLLGELADGQDAD